MAHPLFNSTQDANVLHGFVSEYPELIREPRALYQKRTMTPVSGTDGVTSVDSTRQFTSASADFTNVLEGSILSIRDETDTEDNGDFLVSDVVDANTLEIDEDWPYGSNTGLTFEVNYHDIHGYAESQTPLFTATSKIPFLLIMNPSEKQLEEYGIDKKVDAIVVFSTKVLSDASITPGDGDRFLDDANREHELVSVWISDRFSGTNNSLRWVGGSRVTEKDRVIPIPT
jgi:hypothetical protein